MNCKSKIKTYYSTLLLIDNEKNKIIYEPNFVNSRILPYVCACACVSIGIYYSSGGDRRNNNNKKK